MAATDAEVFIKNAYAALDSHWKYTRQKLFAIYYRVSAISGCVQDT